MRAKQINLRLGACVMAAGLVAGTGSTSGAEELLPVISKMQVMYSLVGHYNSIIDRIAFYNGNGGNTNYVVPHLVYEPFVTLYNPHNTELRIPRSRVRLLDPPVAFKFKKNNDYLRTEWAAGDTFHGLGRFQIANQSNPSARKTFTMVLTDGSPEAQGVRLVLQPGESKTFGVRVQASWSWAWETSGGYSAKCFFDWDNGVNFTNRDNRTSNFMGVECVPALSFRAGFQTDFLSTSNPRPQATKYSFEASRNDGFVNINLTDQVGVEAKALRTMPNSLSAPDFQLDLLRGVNADPVADTAKTFSFDAAYLAQPGASGPGIPAITRTFVAGDILQTPADATSGGKKPFALFTIAARSQALREGSFQAAVQPPSNELYETRLDEVASFEAVSKAGPSDAPLSGIAVSGIERVGDFLMLDIMAAPGQGSTVWKVKGSSDSADGFPDDLTSQSSIIEGPAGTGIYKARINVSGRGSRYFVRIES